MGSTLKNKLFVGHYRGFNIFCSTCETSLPTCVESLHTTGQDSLIHLFNTHQDHLLSDERIQSIEIIRSLLLNTFTVQTLLRSNF